MSALRLSIKEIEQDFPNIMDEIRKGIDKKNASNKKGYVMTEDGVFVTYQYAERIMGHSFQDVLNDIQGMSQKPKRLENFLKYCENTEDTFEPRKENIFLTGIDVFDKNEKKICSIKLKNNIPTQTFFDVYIKAHQKFGEIYNGTKIFVYEATNDWLEEKALVGYFIKNDQEYFVLAGKESSIGTVSQLRGNILVPVSIISEEKIKDLINNKNLIEAGVTITPTPPSKLLNHYFYDAGKEIGLLIASLSRSKGFMMFGEQPTLSSMDTSVNLDNKIKVYLNPKQNKDQLEEVKALLEIPKNKFKI